MSLIPGFLRRFFRAYGSYKYYKHLFSFLKAVGIKEKTNIVRWKENHFFTCEWNSLFRLNPKSVNQGYIYYAPDFDLPRFMEIKHLILKDRPVFFIMTGRYVSPSDFSPHKGYQGLYLSQMYHLALKNKYFLYMRFPTDETVELMMMDISYSKAMKKYYPEYHPIFSYAKYDRYEPLYIVPEKGFNPYKPGLVFQNFASLYLLTLTRYPIELTVQFILKSNAPINVRIHVNMTKIKDIQVKDTQTVVKLENIYLNPLQGHGIEILNRNDSDEDVEISIQKLNYSMKEMTFSKYCQLMPFDKFQRHQIIKNIIEFVRSKGMLSGTSQVLDIGGNPGYLHNFIPELDILVVDEDPCDFVHQMPANLFKRYKSFESGFDVVTAIDVLEHVSAKQRNAFLDSICKSSKKIIILSFPVNKPEIHEAEKLLYEFETQFLKHDNRYLREHLDQPLPRPESIIEYCVQRGISYKVMPNAYLPRWFSMMFLNLAKEYLGEDASSIQEFNRLYNEQFFESDNKNPGYRMVMILSKFEGEIDSLTEQMERDPNTEELAYLNYPSDLISVFQEAGHEEIANWLTKNKETLEKVENILF